MRATLQQHIRATILPDGRRALVLDYQIPEDAPQAVREGLARRAVVNGGGDCPCGASWPRPNRAQRRKLEDPAALLRVDVVHAEDCPAGTELLLAAVRAWEATR
jgi:hypothetical protein